MLSPKKFILIIITCINSFVCAQNEAKKVNVFLGTSGDHGQMSPAASYPFGLLSIGPQTYPNLHAGYEFKAKQFLGFTHTRMEGVGCMGAGGNFLLKPIINGDVETSLIKQSDNASPGFYKVIFENGISTKATVAQNVGKYQFAFPRTAGFLLDIGYAFVNRFVDAKYTIEKNIVSGYADAKSTCDQGKYRIYFCFRFPKNSSIKEIKTNQLLISVPAKYCEVDVAVSSVSEKYAQDRLRNESFENIKRQSESKWNELLGRVKVEGNKEDTDWFYSLLYRTLQSPFLISEPDGAYRATDGSLQKSSTNSYHGWAVWDNFRDQLPLFSLIYPEIYADLARSLADMYKYGKTQWATEHAPSITVRTEHTVGVLLDAVNKGIDLPIDEIALQIKDDADSWKLTSPEKILEASYDYWAASELFRSIGKSDWANTYLNKSRAYRETWIKDFKDVESSDADKMGARGIYQGTVWQYRWLVPHDIAGLKTLMGGEENFITNLDTFFNKDFYNHGNETDTQVPSLYNATSQPWKSQILIRKLLKGEVIQYYFNDNSKGIDPYIGRIYKNQPDAYLRTMDDDAGAMSGWWVMRSLGFSAANVGNPIFYLNAPLFKKFIVNYPDGRTLEVTSKNSEKYPYIKSINLGNQTIQRNWLKYTEILNAGSINFTLVPKPDKKFGVLDKFESGIR